MQLHFQDDNFISIHPI